MDRNISETLKETPLIDAAVYEKLPVFLQKCTEHFEDSREKDVVLLSCLTVISGMFPTVSGKYHTNHSHANLFCFITAPPASSKSSMLYGRQLANAEQDRCLQQNDQIKAAHDSAMSLWKQNKKANPNQPPPPKPKYPVFLFPGNTTAAALYRRMNESDGIGVLAESEADTLSNAIGSDFGNFDDLLRKVFHHEPVSLTRVTDDVLINIKKPRMSVLLSGTPDQVPRLIYSAENGLFSRFSFYVYSKELAWNDPTPCEECSDLTAFFEAKSVQLRNMKDEMDKQEHVFHLSKEQFAKLSKNFEAKINDIKRFEGAAAASVVYRLGLIAFRIAMIFSILRQFETKVEKNGKIRCTDEDLTATLLLTDVLFQHSMLMYAMLPKGGSSDAKTREFFNALPGEVFSRSEADKIGETLNLKERTVGNYLNSFLTQGILTKPKFGFYQKATG